jgi:hypothetical protein
MIFVTRTQPGREEEAAAEPIALAVEPGERATMLVLMRNERASPATTTWR